MLLKFIRIIPIFIITTLFFAVQSAFAHGGASTISIDETTVTILAKFDDGEIMNQAQVVIYSPDDPENEWLTGVADDDGIFSFAIDPELEGRWSVKVRKAGHGEFIYLNVAADGTVSAENESNGLVRSIMAVFIVAVFFIIALIYSQKNKRNTENQSEKEAYART